MGAAFIPNNASAAAAAAPLPSPAAASTAAGAWAVGGFAEFVAVLDLYDIIRRTTCSGDFLALGGPGFGERITPAMNVLPPRCAPAPAARHKKH